MSLPCRLGVEEPAGLSTADIRDRHAQMYLALADETKALRAERHQRGRLLPAGVLVRQVHGAFHYAFRLGAAEDHLRPGLAAECVVSDVTHACGVAARDDNDLVLSFKTYLGDQVNAGAILVVDAVWLVEALQRRLTDGIRSLTHGEPCTPAFNLETALRVIGEGTFTPEEGRPCLEALRGQPSLNTAQRRAVKLAYGSDVTFIFGPPGTGKTTTVARAIEAHARAGRSVLVLAPSNRAVDVLVGAVAERLSGHRGFDRGLVLRFGERVTGELRRTHGPHVCYGQVVERLRRERLVPARMRLDAETQAVKDELRELRSTLGSDAEEPLPAPPARLLRALRRRHARLTARFRRLVQRRRDVARADAFLPRRLLAECTVLGTTLHQSYVSPELTRQYDVVVIDEASMAQTAQVYAAAGLAAGHGGKVIIAGDYMQIPPVVAARTPRADVWLGTDVFHTVGIPGDIARGEVPPYVALLDVQHRMSPGICALVNHLFYAGRLRTAAAVRRRARIPSPLANTDVFYIDSSAVAPRVRTPDGITRINLEHVLIAEDLLAELDSGGVLAETGERCVSVISPFKGQGEVMRRRLGGRYAGCGVDVSTAHRSQGSESDVVILDLTDAPGLPVSEFLGAGSIASAGPRMLNVAMSRARHQLYVVGALRFLERNGGRVVRSLIAYLRQEAQSVKLSQIRGSAAQVYGCVDRSGTDL